MKLSEKTVNLLKNFAGINQSILFKKGNKLRTMSVMKNILAEAEVEEEFPKDFAIYDLVQFLNGVSLYANPQIEFTTDSNLTIREGKDRKTNTSSLILVLLLHLQRSLSLCQQKMFASVLIAINLLL